MNLLSKSIARMGNNSPLCFLQIGFVDFKSDKSFHPAALRRHRGITDAKKGIQHGFDA